MSLLFRGYVCAKVFSIMILNDEILMEGLSFIGSWILLYLKLYLVVSRWPEIYGPVKYKYANVTLKQIGLAFVWLLCQGNPSFEQDSHIPNLNCPSLI